MEGGPPFDPDDLDFDFETSRRRRWERETGERRIEPGREAEEPPSRERAESPSEEVALRHGREPTTKRTSAAAGPGSTRTPSTRESAALAGARSRSGD